MAINLRPPTTAVANAKEKPSCCMVVMATLPATIMGEDGDRISTQQEPGRIAAWRAPPGCLSDEGENDSNPKHDADPHKAER